MQQADYGGFSREARRVLALAQAEANRRRRRTVGTEHLLVGLISNRQGITARVLREVGVDLGVAYPRLQTLTVDWDEPDRDRVGLTVQMMRVLDYVVDEARSHHSADADTPYMVETAHVLLGLLDLEDERPEHSILEYVGVDRAAVRANVEQHLRSSQD